MSDELIPDDVWVTGVRAIAKALGLSHATTHRLLEAGKIPGSRGIYGVWRIKRDALEVYKQTVATAKRQLRKRVAEKGKKPPETMRNEKVPIAALRAGDVVDIRWVVREVYANGNARMTMLHDSYSLTMPGKCAVRVVESPIKVGDKVMWAEVAHTVLAISGELVWMVAGEGSDSTHRIVKAEMLRRTA